MFCLHLADGQCWFSSTSQTCFLGHDIEKLSVLVKWLRGTYRAAAQVLFNQLSGHWSSG